MWRSARARSASGPPSSTRRSASPLVGLDGSWLDVSGAARSPVARPETARRAAVRPRPPRRLRPGADGVATLLGGHAALSVQSRIHRPQRRTPSVTIQVPLVRDPAGGPADLGLPVRGRFRAPRSLENARADRRPVPARARRRPGTPSSSSTRRTMRFSFVNQGAVEQTGFTWRAVRVSHFDLAVELAEEAYREILAAHTGRRIGVADDGAPERDGPPCRWTSASRRSRPSGGRGGVAVARDVSSSARGGADRLPRLHDELTGLPNRAMLREHLASRSRAPSATATGRPAEHRPRPL